MYKMMKSILNINIQQSSPVSRESEPVLIFLKILKSEDVADLPGTMDPFLLFF